MGFEERMGKLLRILMNKSVLDSKAREEIEEILGSFTSEDGISAIKELVCKLVEEAPYISREQADALVGDLESLFDKLDTADTKTSLDEKIEEIKNDLEKEEFPFNLNEIPQDAASTEGLKRVIGTIIEDVFGKLINNLPSDDRLRLRVQLEQVIEREVDKYICERG